jgi:putative restriction endonuclease
MGPRSGGPSHHPDGPGPYDAIVPVYVVADDPGKLTFKVAADTAALGDPRLMLGGSEPLLKASATGAVKRRLHQRRFRELVVTAYGERCAVCRLHRAELLDAAHILEDRDERGKPEVPNGLSLCKIHHGTYDANMMGVAPDYRIHIRADVLEDVDGPMLRHGLQEIHGGVIEVPVRVELRPRREYLEARYAAFRAA